MFGRENIMKLFIISAFTVILASLCMADERPERRTEIVVATFADADPKEEKEKLFVIGNRIYRTIEEVAKRISGSGGYPSFQTHFVIYGTCDLFDPRLNSEEIDILRTASEKAGVLFTYFPGG